jgi:hypothetical protein
MCVWAVVDMMDLELGIEPSIPGGSLCDAAAWSLCEVASWRALACALWLAACSISFLCV